MEKSIQCVKEELQRADEEEREKLIALYQNDTRKGIISLLARYGREKQRLEHERERLQKMWYFENKYAEEFPLIAGIDEVGRGPLAGPVVAAAVILPKNCEIQYLNDSKKLSPERREQLFGEITEKAVAYGIGIVSPAEIDRINILQATYRAMREAVSELKVSPDCLLVDALTIPDIICKQVGIIKGDEKSASIAAASIVAKVTRDRKMEELAAYYPDYDFANNKGYGAPKHIAGLKKYGPCEIHRYSFIKKYLRH